MERTWRTVKKMMKRRRKMMMRRRRRKRKNQRLGGRTSYGGPITHTSLNARLELPTGVAVGLV